LCGAFPVTEETDLESMLLAQRKDFWQLLDRTDFSPPPDHVNVIGRFDLIQETMLLKNPMNASTGLSMNGKSPVISTAPPFVLRFSKDERRVFQQNRLSCLIPMLCIG
jgi:hypothetical protein